MSQTLEAPKRTRLRDGINHVAYSPDGKQCAFADVHMNLMLPCGVSVYLQSPNEKVRPTERIRDVVFSRDGRSVIAAAGDHIWEFDASTGEERWRYWLPRVLGFLIVSSMSLAVSDSGLLAASSDNGHVYVWNESRSFVMKYRANEQQRGLAFAGKTDELVAFEGFAVNRYDVHSGKRISRLSLPNKAYGMALSPDGNLAAVRTLSQVLVLNAQTGEILHQRNVEPGLPLLEFHPTKPVIAIGEDRFVSFIDLDRFVSFIDLAGNMIDQARVDDAEVISFAFAPDGSKLSIGCSDHQIRHHPI